jgi:hypothetical protein
MERIPWSQLGYQDLHRGHGGAHSSELDPDRHRGGEIRVALLQVALIASWDFVARHIPVISHTGSPLGLRLPPKYAGTG